MIREYKFSPSVAGVLFALFLFGLSGCAPNQSQSSPVALNAPQASAPAAAPLDLCKPSPEPPATLEKTKGYRQFLVRVTDASGHPVTGLTEGNFVFTRNGRAIPIRFFDDSAGKAPTSVVVIVDDSASMSFKMSFRDNEKLMTVRDSLAGVFRQINVCDEVAVLTFGESALPDPLQTYKIVRRQYTPIIEYKGGYSTVTGESRIVVIQPFTTDHELAGSRLVTQGFAFGETPLFDAIHYGLQVLRGSRYRAKSLVVVSDGMDTVSARSQAEVADEAVKNGVVIDAVAVGLENRKLNQDAAKLSDLELGMTASVGIVLESRAPVAGYVEASVSGKDNVPFREIWEAQQSRDTTALRMFSDATGGITLEAAPITRDAGKSLIAAQHDIQEMLGRVYTIGIVAPELPADQLPSLKINGKPGAVAHILPNIHS